MEGKKKKLIYLFTWLHNVFRFKNIPCVLKHGSLCQKKKVISNIHLWLDHINPSTTFCSWITTIRKTHNLPFCVAWTEHHFIRWWNYSCPWNISWRIHYVCCMKFYRLMGSKLLGKHSLIIRWDYKCSSITSSPLIAHMSDSVASTE